jgi:NADH:ubiquinone oxidoreductase subunit 5 (subunit L)/multisubunit Na+/H+ antiporter MnhA subunit
MLGEAGAVRWRCSAASPSPTTSTSAVPETPKAGAQRHRGLYQFLLNKWYFDELYDFLFVRPAKWLGSFLWKRATAG